jgi:hypothetical protein
MRPGGRIKQLAVRVVSDEYLDLYILGVAALTFTILGVVGVADIKVLASVTLALLAVLAFSQIRSRRHVAEAERLWEDGTPWPLAPAEALKRSARPVFKDQFGPELELSMNDARELLITGVTRNTLIMGRYNKFEDWLKKGCGIRILLIEPSSDAIVAAADRYYAERSPDSTRNRIRHTLRLLGELKRSTNGNLSVRLTAHPLALGVIAVDATPDVRSDASALFAEYYTYQAPGEPKFVLQPADGRWFENLYQEAEALWAGADDYNLASRPDDA